jgi:hypothetical protein
LLATSKKIPDNNETWRNIINYARWSPSPHNVQPWKIKVISTTEADLYYDPSRLLPVVDPTSAFTIAGLGMFIESMNIAATSYGYKVMAQHSDEAALDTESNGPKFFAKLKLVPAEKQENIDPELLKKRRTSRQHYNAEVVSDTIIKSLQALATSYSYKLNYTSETHLIHEVLKLNSETIVQTAYEKAPRMELAKWIRTTDKESEEKKDGLSYNCMQLPGRLMYNFFNNHQKYETRWKDAYLRHYITHSASGTRNLAWITGPFENKKDWLNAGTMLQRLWLKMTEYNIYLQPLGAIINEPRGMQNFQKMIDYKETDGTIWLLFRLGYSTEPPRSLRLEVNDLLI